MSSNNNSQKKPLFPVPETNDPVNDVWRLILRANAKMLNMLLQECPDVAPGQKITYSRIRVLTYLAQANGDRVNIHDLSEELGITSGGVSQMIDSLVKSDMVCRTTSKEDRRVVYLSISESAKKRLDHISSYLHDRMERAMKKLTRDDRAQLADSLRKVLEAFYEEA